MKNLFDILSTNIRVEGNSFLDQLIDTKTDLFKLNTHTINHLHSNDKELYLKTLTAVVFAQKNPLTKEQSKLLTTLIASTDTNKNLKLFLEDAQDYTKETLLDFLQAAKNLGYGNTFFLDVLVLLRVGGIFSESDHVLLSELVDALSLEATDIQEIVLFASLIFDIDCPFYLPRPVDYDYSAYSAWDDFLFRRLTEADLQQGLLPSGRWYIESPLTLNSDFIMEQVTLKFLNQGQLGCADDIKIQWLTCQLLDPQIVISKNCQATFRNCSITGNYKLSDAITAIRANENSMTKIIDCYLSTINARSFRGEWCNLYVHNSQFIKCGNPHLYGGAIGIKNKHDQPNFICAFEATRFEECFSKFGGAINAHTISYIDCCQFIKNYTYGSPKHIDENNYHQSLLSAGAIFALSMFSANYKYLTLHPSYLTHNVFLDNSLNFKTSTIYNTRSSFMSASSSFKNQFDSSGVATSDTSLGFESVAQIKLGLSKNNPIFIDYANDPGFRYQSSWSEDI